MCIYIRDEILMSIGNSPEIRSQRILVGIILVERLGIWLEGSPFACQAMLPCSQHLLPLCGSRAIHVRRAQ